MPAAGLVRVAGSTITGRIGNKEMGIKLNPSASRTPQASFFDPAASLRCRTVCETGADRCRACGPSTLVSGDVTSAEGDSAPVGHIRQGDTAQLPNSFTNTWVMFGSPFKKMVAEVPGMS